MRTPVIVMSLVLLLGLAACNGNDPAPPPPTTLMEGSVVFCTDGGLPPCR